jgi:hypothetical protein
VRQGTLEFHRAKTRWRRVGQCEQAIPRSLQSLRFIRTDKIIVGKVDVDPANRAPLWRRSFSVAPAEPLNEARPRSEFREEHIGRNVDTCFNNLRRDDDPAGLTEGRRSPLQEALTV